MPRHRVHSIFAGVLAIGAVGVLLGNPGTLRAQSKYPDKPVHIIVPYGAGGVADVSTRLVAQKMSAAMGQSFVIENRPGAGGIVAGKAVASSPPDGYTLFIAGNSSAIGVSLFKSLPFDVLRDFTAVAPLAEFEMLLATKADSPLRTLAEVVDYAKAHPGKLNLGTIAAGSTQNLSAELFKMVTGAQATVVIYKTTPELVTAIVRGDVDVGFDYYAGFAPSIVNKQVRVIVSSGERRSPQLPDVPTVKESGYPSYVVTSWNAFQGPAGLPKDIVSRLNEQIVAALKTPDIAKRMSDLGIQPMIGSPEALNERLKSDIAKWAKVIQAAGIEKQ